MFGCWSLWSVGCLRGGIYASSLSLILLVKHAAGILCREDSRIIGLRFDGIPFALFGFWSAFNMPFVTSFGMSPVSAMLLHILAISSCILLSGAYCFSDIINCERYRHSCRWYDCSWLFIFIESLFKIFRNNLTLLPWVGGQTVFSFY